MNRQWHSTHPMPAKAALEQRIHWHREHQKECACRGVPQSLAAYVKPRRTPAPSRARRERAV